VKKAERLGYRFYVSPQYSHEDQTDAGQDLIPMSLFDEVNCAVGIEHLEQVRYEWNENLQNYNPTWRHDEHSHAASAFMTGAMMDHVVSKPRPKAQSVGVRRHAT